jgi:glycosyltransferase involved in cell wall biosynthesis
VLLVHNRYRSTSPGGEDRVVDQEHDRLAADGHQVERFERFNGDIDGRTLARKALLPAQVVWSEASRRSLVRAIREFKPEVAHIHNTFPLLSPSVLYACRSEAVPVVATIHHYGLVCANGTLFRDGSVCHDCVGKLPWPAVAHGCYHDSALATVPVASSLLAHRRAWRTMVSAYVFLSQAQRDVLAGDGLPPDRLFVKPNFVLPVAQAAEPDDIVVYAGRLAAVKGLDLLMAAWDEYERAHPAGRLRLVLAGAGPLQDRIEAWSSSRPSVEWRGMLSRAECAALVVRARAVIVPSQWQETFGLVVVEAMAAGVPSVAPAHGSFPELITDGADGTLFPPGDTIALAGVLADIDDDPDRFRSLGRAAFGTYERRFTASHVIAQLLDIYRFAVEHPAG